MGRNIRISRLVNLTAGEGSSSEGGIDPFRASGAAVGVIEAGTVLSHWEDVRAEVGPGQGAIQAEGSHWGFLPHPSFRSRRSAHTRYLWIFVHALGKWARSKGREDPTAEELEQTLEMLRAEFCHKFVEQP